MKKILLALLLIIITILSACAKKQQPSESTTSYPINSTIHQKISTTLSREKSTSTVPRTEITVKDETSNNSTNPTKPQEQNNDNINHEPPYMSTYDIESIIELENACKSMSEDEFEKFLVDNKNYRGSSISSQGDALTALDEVKRSTVILLDGDESNFTKIVLYENSHFWVNTILMNDSPNIICTCYTPYRENVNTMTLGESEKATFIKDISSNGVTAKVYNFDRGDKQEIYAEMLVDESRIVLRVTDEQTIEEFEETFSRLEFIKIGDLINS